MTFLYLLIPAAVWIGAFCLGAFAGLISPDSRVSHRTVEQAKRSRSRTFPCAENGNAWPGVAGAGPSNRNEGERP